MTRTAAASPIEPDPPGIVTLPTITVDPSRFESAAAAFVDAPDHAREVSLMYLIRTQALASEFIKTFGSSMADTRARLSDNGVVAVEDLEAPVAPRDIALMIREAHLEGMIEGVRVLTETLVRCGTGDRVDVCLPAKVSTIFTGLVARYIPKVHIEPSNMTTEFGRGRLTVKEIPQEISGLMKYLLLTEADDEKWGGE